MAALSITFLFHKMFQMTEQYIDPVQVSEYLLIKSKLGGVNTKRIKRKMQKRRVLNKIVSKQCSNFETSAPTCVYEYLVSVRKRKLTSVGVLSDGNIILEDIHTIPPAPLEWDILCLDSHIQSYDFTDKNNNVYWCAATLADTKHFIINTSSLPAVLPLAKSSTSWTEFVEKLNTLNIFTITQHFLSQQLSTFVSPLLDQDVYREECTKKLSASISTSFPQVDVLAQKYDQLVEELPVSEKYNLLPGVSLVCPLSTADRFFHTLHAFNKIDYPRDKLQLIVVDDSDLEKKIKSFLPEDGRVKLLNITRKTKGEQTSLPLSYKLNMGVKYSDKDVIYHFMDSNHYFITNFRKTIKAHVMCNKPVIMSADYAILEGKNSLVHKTPSVANMIYTRNFWKAQSFDQCADENVMLYKWMHNRQSCIEYVPFPYFSFQFTSRMNTKNLPTMPLPFDLLQMVEKSTEESFKIAQV